MVLEKCGHKCVQCGATEDLEVDHIVPLAKGGTDDINNLQILCGTCNREKGIGGSPLLESVNQMLDKRKAEMQSQWAFENDELYRKTPKFP